MELSIILNLVLIGAAAGVVIALFNMLDIDAKIKRVVNLLVIFVVIVWAIRWLIAHLH